MTVRALLQQATRDTLTGQGLDVSGLTDPQMSDNHGWVLFPNFFMTIRAGEATVILALPDPDGDPTAASGTSAATCGCPPEMRGRFQVEPVQVEEPGSFHHLLALQQDYEQLPRRQRCLRNKVLDHMTLVKEEIVIAHFHAAVDRYLAAATAE